MRPVRITQKSAVPTSSFTVYILFSNPISTTAFKIRSNITHTHVPGPRITVLQSILCLLLLQLSLLTIIILNDDHSIACWLHLRSWRIQSTKEKGDNFKWLNYIIVDDGNTEALQSTIETSIGSTGKCKENGPRKLEICKYNEPK